MTCHLLHGAWGLIAAATELNLDAAAQPFPALTAEALPQLLPG